jgi:parvulin-like peptidyl-prolyl isomerase
MKKKSKIAKLAIPKFKVPKKVPKLSMPSRLRGRQKQADAKLVEAIQNLPRITNETVAEHREEVLSSARKYIYPLSHSKRRVVVITSGLLIAAVVLFFTFCTLQLYKFQSTSTFMYGVTQVIPFPVAKAGPAWVSYESYLFELRHSVHYYQVQQKEDFSTKAGKKHLAKLEQDALNQVIQDAYIKQLASKNHVTVSDNEVTSEVNLVRSENRLGSSDQVFKNVLSEFWGWTVKDFQRELKQQLLSQKTVAALDIGTQTRAQNALTQVGAGADFAKLASTVSDDLSTKANGGDYGIQLDRTNHDIDPRVLDVLFKLKPGQSSTIINTGYALEIDKVIDVTGGKVHAAHIVFNFQNINQYVNPLKAKQKPHTYIRINTQ